MLDKFFAVTLTSLYEVSARGEGGHPQLKKIGFKGKSRVSVGGTINGDMLAIAKWLQFYIPEKYGLLASATGIERNLESVNTAYWLGKTSAIVALFFKEDKARECFARGNHEPFDRRWRIQTRKVLNAVEHDHPTITICRWPGLALDE